MVVVVVVAAVAAAAAAAAAAAGRECKCLEDDRQCPVVPVGTTSGRWLEVRSFVIIDHAVSRLPVGFFRNDGCIGGCTECLHQGWDELGLHRREE